MNIIKTNNKCVPFLQRERSLEQRAKGLIAIIGRPWQTWRLLMARGHGTWLNMLGKRQALKSDRTAFQWLLPISPKVDLNHDTQFSYLVSCPRLLLNYQWRAAKRFPQGKYEVHTTSEYPSSLVCPPFLPFRYQCETHVCWQENKTIEGKVQQDLRTGRHKRSLARDPGIVPGIDCPCKNGQKAKELRGG